jgi:hypothetical protein
MMVRGAARYLLWRVTEEFDISGAVKRVLGHAPQCFVLHVEQLVADGVQELHPEPVVPLKLLPTEKAQADSSLFTFLPWHSGHVTASESPNTSSSNAFPHWSHSYS